MPTNRPVQTQDKIGEILEYCSDIEELADEMRSWADGMEGTSLESTQKYEEVSGAADTLESAGPDLEEACKEVKRLIEAMLKEEDELSLLDVDVKYTERKMYKGYMMPRWVRLHNPVSALGAVVEYLERLEIEELKDSLDSLSSALGDLETVEFPGMY